MPLLDLKSLILAIGVSVAPSWLAADPWFYHSFDELRSYHGDWLDVCDDNGAGACRAVQYYRPEDFDSTFGQSRLAITFEANDTYSIEVYDQGMPDYVDDISFDFGTFALTPDEWQLRLGMDAPEGQNRFAEVFFVEDPIFAATLVNAIRTEHHLVVYYRNPDGSYGEAPFSLRGSAAALLAIEDHLFER